MAVPPESVPPPTVDPSTLPHTHTHSGQDFAAWFGDDRTGLGEGRPGDHAGSVVKTSPPGSATTAPALRAGVGRGHPGCGPTISTEPPGTGYAPTPTAPIRQVLPLQERNPIPRPAGHLGPNSTGPLRRSSTQPSPKRTATSGLSATTWRSYSTSNTHSTSHSPWAQSTRATATRRSSAWSSASR